MKVTEFEERLSQIVSSGRFATRIRTQLVNSRADAARHVNHGGCRSARIGLIAQFEEE